MKLINGDCFELFKSVPDHSVDFICADLPYGTSGFTNEWDKVIPMRRLWPELKRVLKPNHVIALFGSEPFASMLRSSNPKMYKYDWYYIKTRGANFLNVKFMPFKNVETISIFSDGGLASNCAHKMPYYPIMRIGKPYVRNRSNDAPYKVSAGGRKGLGTVDTVKPGGERYPFQDLHFKLKERAIHPTEKPTELLAYLIKTYTKPGEVVLDCCMGSASCALAALNTGREFIGFEKDEKYYWSGLKRLINKSVDMGNSTSIDTTF